MRYFCNSNVCVCVCVCIGVGEGRCKRLLQPGLGMLRGTRWEVHAGSR